MIFKNKKLWKAVYAGDKEKVLDCIQKGANVNWDRKSIWHGDSCTLMDMAIDKDRKEIVELLIAHGANANYKNKNKRYRSTPLEQAVWMGQVEIVELLIQHGAKVNQLTSDDGTPLDVAYDYTEVNKEAIVLVLKNHGALTGAQLADPDAVLRDFERLFRKKARELVEKDFTLKFQSNQEKLKGLAFKEATISLMNKYKLTPTVLEIMRARIQG